MAQNNQKTKFEVGFITKVASKKVVYADTVEEALMKALKKTVKEKNIYIPEGYVLNMEAHCSSKNSQQTAEFDAKLKDMDTRTFIFSITKGDKTIRLDEGNFDDEILILEKLITEKELINKCKRF